jgi:hypothetical protein
MPKYLVKVDIELSSWHEYTYMFDLILQNSECSVLLAVDENKTQMFGRLSFENAEMLPEKFALPRRCLDHHYQH